MRRYRHARLNGTWSSVEGLAACMRVASARIIAGRGPFSVLVNGHTVAEHRRRKAALNRTDAELEDRPYGTIVGVRNPRRRVFVAKPVEVVPPVRARAVYWAKWSVAHAGRIHYSQDRPYHQYPKGYAGEMREDCTGSIGRIYRWSGANDPLNASGGGYGNSGTLFARPSISRGSALPGDTVAWSNEHGVMFVEPGSHSDPLVYSQGSEAGPYLYRLSTAVRLHGGDYRCQRMQF